MLKHNRLTGPLEEANPLAGFPGIEPAIGEGIRLPQITKTIKAPENDRWGREVLHHHPACGLVDL